jgi:hypothetical protein
MRALILLLICALTFPPAHPLHPGANASRHTGATAYRRGNCRGNLTTCPDRHTDGNARTSAMGQAGDLLGVEYIAIECVRAMVCLPRIIVQLMANEFG